MPVRLLAGACVVAAAAAGCAARSASVPVVTAAGVRFVLEHREARSVTLAGSFNEWSTSSHPLTRNDGGPWTITVRLPRGEHAFIYVVNGAEWLTPPLAEEYVDDGFGTRNGVVVVR